MAGTTRRNKPLKAKTVLSDISEFLIANPANGDLLVFNSGTSLWQNVKVLTGDYTLAGDLSLTTLSASGLVSLADSLTVAVALTVTGASSLQDTLAVGGAATLSSTLGVTGAVTLSDALSVTGTLTGAGFSFSGDGTVTGTLGVTGILTAGILKPASIVTTGDASVGGNFDVTGLSFFTGDVTIGDNLSAAAIAGTSLSTIGALSVDGTAIIGGNTTIGGTIQFGVTGTLSHDGTDVTLANLITSGEMKFTGIQADLTTNDMLTLDPDGAAALHWLGSPKILTTSTGGEVIDEIFDLHLGTTTSMQYLLRNSGGGATLHMDNGDSRFRIFQTDDLAAIEDLWIQCLRDGAVSQFHNGTEMSRTATAANGGLLVNNTVTGGGFERVLTIGDLGASSLGGLSDVTLTTPTTFGILYKSAGDWLDTDAILVNPAGAFEAKFNTSDAFKTTAGGISIHPSTDAANATVEMFDSTGASLIIEKTDNTVGVIKNVDPGHGINLQALDAGSVNVNMFACDPDASCDLYYDGVLAAQSTTGGFKVLASKTATTATVEMVDNGGKSLIIEKTNGTIGVIKCVHAGFGINLQALDAGSVNVNMLAADPDASVDLFFDGAKAFATTVEGAAIFDTSGSAPVMSFRTDADVEQAAMFSDGTNFIVRGLVHGGRLLLEAEDAGGVLRTLILADPDNVLQLYHGGVAVFKTLSTGVAALGQQFDVDNSGSAVAAKFKVRNSEGGMELRTDGGTTSLFETNSGGSVTGTWGVFAAAARVELRYNSIKEFETKSAGVIITNELEIDGDLNHDGSNVGLYGTTPAAQSSAYTRNATIVEDRTLLASASATIINNNNVLAALIADLQSRGFIG